VDGGYTFIIVAVFFIPVYLKNKIFTMPQFLHQRYNGTVAMVMAIFWLLLYIVVNLMSILYLGRFGYQWYIRPGYSFVYLVAGYILGIYYVGWYEGYWLYRCYTGSRAYSGWFNGVLSCTYLVKRKRRHYRLVKRFKILHSEASDHFHMIFKKDNPNYMDLPGLSVLIGGMWITNLNYWGCNQYITQRALGANLKTARGGILFAAFLKVADAGYCGVAGYRCLLIISKRYVPPGNDEFIGCIGS
jgi:SSS family solute:Na+ symporter